LKVAFYSTADTVCTVQWILGLDPIANMAGNASFDVHVDKLVPVSCSGRLSENKSYSQRPIS
jgi:hypothetical protein